MTSLPRSCSRPPRCAASTSAPARSARAPATAATWLACTCSSPRDAPPVPGASSKKRQTAASRARRPTLTRPTRVTAWRTVWARTGRAHAAELAKRRTLAASPGSVSMRGDELVGVGLGIAGELADASQGTIEHRQLADAPDGVLQLRRRRWGVLGRGEHRPGPIVGRKAQELSGRAPRRTAAGPVERAGGRRSALRRLERTPGCRCRGRLVGRAALRLVDLGRDHRVLPYEHDSRPDVSRRPPPMRVVARMNLASPDRGRLRGPGVGGYCPACCCAVFELLLDDPALVVRDLQALLQDRGSPRPDGRSGAGRCRGCRARRRSRSRPCAPGRGRRRPSAAAARRRRPACPGR